MIQKNYKLVRDDLRVIDGKKELNKQVLLQTFNDFYKANFTEEEKHNFNKNAVSTAFCFASANKKLIWNIRIYETLGLDRNKVINQDDIDESYLDLYSKKLSEAGLSLNEHFTSKELEELEKEDPDYLRKRDYIGKGR